ncbi:MAG: penicillin-binding protein 2 [Alphaproteobacteria bacterium]|nr:penicillin-binding protein 2 [Alphaproteobacteria bacterium]OJV47170.1 MAG: penicillin-binding protein 2 [Alphaproteobacteria bacterium 43-37]
MDQPQLENIITRRIFMLGLGKGALLSLILGRMYYLQIVEGKKYELLADKNRISWRFKSKPRGRILDCQGHEMSSNKGVFNLVADHDALKNIHPLLETIGKYIPIDEDHKKWVIRELKRNPPYIPTIVKSNLSWEEVTSIELNASELQGAYIENSYQRDYLNGSAFAAITGYVSTPTPNDVEAEPLLKLPGLRVGRQGLEKTYDHHLQGEPAHEQLEVNARNRIVRKLSQYPGRVGGDINLTIHNDLHLKCLELMNPHQAGSCLLMDIHTGEILTYISHPSYNPNLFANGIQKQDWQALQNDPLRPLINRPISGLYPPGSTFKMLVILAALEEGLIDSNTQFFCNGALEMGSHIFHCWHTHGQVDLVKAIAASCDIYIYQIALRLGADKISAIARRFGFGSLTGIELEDEKSGLVPDKSWKKKTKKASWYPGDTLNFSIGQGFFTATPIQIARMIAALANGGRLVTPHLCKLHEGHEYQEIININPAHLDLIHLGMMHAIHEPYGTSHSAAPATGGILMAGKTGSSQVKRIHMEDRLRGLHKSASRAWADLEHAIFSGFAPYDNPRYGVCVVIEHGGGGGRVAGPIGVGALRLCLEHFQNKN